MPELQSARDIFYLNHRAILKDVSIKVSDPAYYEMHIDTDDANANLIKNGDVATILGIDDKNS